MFKNFSQHYVILSGVLLISMGVVHHIQRLELKDCQMKVNELNQKIDSLSQANDTLRWELVPTQFELNRYIQGLETFRKKNPTAAKEYIICVSEGN